MKPEAVDAPGAPAAAGFYVHAVRAGSLLFCSGQLGLDPGSGELVGEGAGGQAARALQNLEAVCTAAGTSLARAVKLTLYLIDMSAFGEVNAVYEGFFAAGPPARVAVGVSALPRGAAIMIDAVVALPGQ